MNRLLLLLVGVVSMVQLARATDCPSATAIPAAPTFPYTVSLTCGATNDITSANATACGSSFYFGGQEALYSWTPSGNYSGVTIAYTGQTWSGIFVYAGCPTSGGTCVANVTSSASSKTLTVPGTFMAGTTYYIMFDTWPAPNSPCPGSFTMNGTLIAPCTAPPTAGTVSAASNPVCPSVNNVLSLTAGTSGTGQTYQWQQSASGNPGSFSNIASATGATYTSNISTATYFRAVVTCSGMSDTTAPLLINMNSFTNCYCTSIPTQTADEEIYNVKINSDSTNTLYSYSNGCSTIAPGPGSILNRYSNFKTLPALTTLYLNSSNSFAIREDECDGATYYFNGVGIWIDYNQNGLFTDPGEQVYVEPTTSVGPKTVSGTFTVPGTALPGNTVMRVITAEGYAGASLTPCLSYSYGETEDHIVTIACPNLTSANAIDQGICSNSAATFTGTPSFPGSTISWWDAAVGGTQLNVGNSYTTGTLATTTDFYYQVDYPGCPSSPRDTVTAIVTPVSLTLTAINNTCNGGNTGSFALGTVSCGTAPFTYSMDNGVTFGAIPTDLVAGTYFVIVKDATNALSAPIQVIITEPAMPSALTATGITYYDATLSWTTTGTETSWTVIYGPTGFDPATSGTVISAATNPQLLDNVLTEQTTYDFYVFANCGPVADTAGPYTFTTDSGFLAFDNDCGPGFIDITATGTPAGFTNLDDDVNDVVLPWSWNINGQTVSTIGIGTNGSVAFGAGAFVSYNPTGTGMFICNADLQSIDANGAYYQSIGTAPNRQFIIQWTGMQDWPAPGAGSPSATFEIIVDEATMEVYYIYDNAPATMPAYSLMSGIDIALYTSNGNSIVQTTGTTNIQNNSCYHFYPSLCPNVINATVSSLLPDQVTIDWSAGLYGETNWTIIYGPDGFDPATSGSTQTSNVPTITIPGLTQNTQYDFYIYSECAADNLTSDGLLVNVLTPPVCSNPTAFTVNALTDTLDASWNWAATVGYAATLDHFNVGYVNALPGYTIQNNGTIVNTGSINLYDTIADATLLAGGVYQVYLQAVCQTAGDTSAWVGPITVVMPLDNDVPCGAETLALATDYLFNNTGATVDFDETAIAPPVTGAQETDGWANSTLNNTTWFKFVAPASGSVRINNTLTSYSGQTGVYSVASCGDYLNNFNLLAANDDAIGGTSLASNFTVCGLTPGNEYYILHDGTGTTGNYSINVTEIVLEAGSALTMPQICYGSTIDLNTTISGNDNGGVWSAPVAAANASITGSTFNSNGLADVVFDFQYRVTDGCAYDSIVSQVEVVAPSSAGVDGVITACKNEPIELLNGLSGNIDLGGTWYDPTNAAMASSAITASAFPGSFNYDYIVGNGVCPDDTANVVVNVLSSCDYLNINEQVFAGVSVYPNPSTGVIFIESDMNFAVSVTDANGREVTASTAVTANQTATIDLTTVQIGVYFIKLSNADSSKVYRIVVE